MSTSTSFVSKLLKCDLDLSFKVRILLMLALSGAGTVGLMGLTVLVLIQQEVGEKVIWHFLLNSLWVVIPCTILCLSFSYGAITYTTKFLNVLASQIKRVKEGDLSHRLPEDGKGEMKMLCTELNSLSSNVSRILADVKSSSESLGHSISTIESSLSSFDTVASEQQMALQQINEAINDLVNTSTEISQSSDKSAQDAKNINTQAQQTSASMEGLIATAEKINGVIGVIRDISEQTNLLALNASIEAARAGDAGRGFAVVADEVKKLANSTHSSTQEISDVVAMLQKEMSRSVQSVKDMVSGVEGIYTQVDSVTGSVQNQSSAVAEISATVEEFSSQMNSTTSTMSNAAGTVKGLNTSSSDLLSKINVFKL